MNKNRMFILLASGLMSLSSCNGPMTFSSSLTDSNDYEYPLDSRPDYIDPSTVDLPEFSIHTKLQYAYINSNYKNILKFAKGNEELSRPMPIKLDCGEYNRIQISRTSSFNSYIEEDVNEGSYDFYNGEIGATYYYRNEIEGEIKSFTISDECPRNLYIDGVTNVRDLGGYITSSGKRVKQGLIYRGGRLNASSVDEYKEEITDQGLNALTNTLGVHTELDLRRPDYKNETGERENKSIDGIDHYYLVPLDINESDASQKENYKKIFDYLGDENNYPLYFHCDIGTDRTGYVAFLVLNLLGVSEIDVYRDYLFSNFAAIGSSRTSSQLLSRWSQLHSYGANTYQEAARTHLRGLGISDATMDSIVDILLDI